jgi:NTP pyrophosphatase (non-canonical NTP hydrolase)
MSKHSPDINKFLSGYNVPFAEVKAELLKQYSKWGIQNHTPEWWLVILGEEVGEANKAILENKLSKSDIGLYRDELIQVAAVALSAIECLDRLAENYD